MLFCSGCTCSSADQDSAEVTYAPSDRLLCICRCLASHHGYQGQCNRRDRHCLSFGLNAKRQLAGHVHSIAWSRILNINCASHPASQPGTCSLLCTWPGPLLKAPTIGTSICLQVSWGCQPESHAAEVCFRTSPGALLTKHHRRLHASSRLLLGRSSNWWGTCPACTQKCTVQALPWHGVYCWHCIS